MTNTDMRRETTAGSGAKQGDFLRPFLGGMTEAGWRYCVLHSHEGLPDRTESDVDMTVHGVTREQFETYLTTVARAVGWEVVQRLWYDVPTCFYYVLRARQWPSAWVAVDVLMDPVGAGRYGFSSAMLTADPVREGMFYHPNPATEFCYKLSKRIRKGFLKPEDTRLLRGLFAAADRDVVNTHLRTHFGKWGAQLILDAFADPKGFGGRVPRMRTLGLLHLLRRRYGSIARLGARGYWQIRRVFNRVTSPAGLILRIPCDLQDVEQVRTQLLTLVGPAFRRVRISARGATFSGFAALSSSTLLLCPCRGRDARISVQAALFHPWRDGDAIGSAIQRSGPTGIARACADLVLAVLRERANTRIKAAPIDVLASDVRTEPPAPMR
jgi:hypothetical protein